MLLYNFMGIFLNYNTNGKFKDIFEAKYLRFSFKITDKSIFIFYFYLNLVRTNYITLFWTRCLGQPYENLKEVEKLRPNELGQLGQLGELG